MGDVLKIRDEYRQVQWAAAIQECKASGLTNKELLYYFNKIQMEARWTKARKDTASLS